MRMIKLLAYIFLLIVFLSCDDRKPRSNSSSGDPRREKLEKFSRDAPLELYCILDQEISTTTLDSICQLKGDLYVQLIFVIKDNKLDTVDFLKGFLFDNEGKTLSSINKFPELERVINTIERNQLRPFASTAYGDFIVGINFRRFCRDAYKDE